jgi:hypothetical protein
MSNFKKTPVQTFTKGSAVTNEDNKYWKQLGVSFDRKVHRRFIYSSISFAEPSNHQRIRIN